MPLTCIGLSHHTAPIEVRERHAFPASRMAEALVALRDYEAVTEAVMLQTCGRLEIYAELSDYDYAQMLGAVALTTGGAWKNYSVIQNAQLWMYNEYKNGDDNDWLSEAISDIYANTSTDIYYQWIDFH